MLWLLVALTLPDNGPWAQVLAEHGGATVDYAAIGPAGLDAFKADLDKADLTGASQAQQMAFWINAYNALTVDLIAENPSVASIRDLDGGKVWTTRSFEVAGRSVTLDTIEHQILRPLGDPRVHAALNCASIGCPPLAPTPYTAQDLDAQLDAAAKRWVATNAWTPQDHQVQLSKIFDWYGDDFLPQYGAAHHDIPNVSGKQEAALNFIAAYAPNPGVAQMAQVGTLPVVWQDYDWGLNKR